MNIADIHNLYAYNLWANTRLFSALDKVSNEQFVTSAQSSFPSLQKTTFHILGAEWLWLKRWKGTSPRSANPHSDTLRWKSVSGLPAETELATAAAMKTFADSIERERQEYLAGLGDARLQAELHYTDVAGNPFSMPLFQLLQHVVNHGTYHRGQATTLLRQLGAETVSLDMTNFFREEQAKKQTT